MLRWTTIVIYTVINQKSIQYMDSNGNINLKSDSNEYNFNELILIVGISLDL